MNNWIEEAEKRQAKRDGRNRSQEMACSENVGHNHDQIGPFIARLREMVERVNRISPDERKPSMEIGFTHLDGESKYEFYGSAFMQKNKKVALVFKSQQYYFLWRRVYFKMSDIEGIMSVTLYEKTTTDDRKRNTRKKRIHNKYQIGSFNDRHVDVIVEWLVYRVGLSAVLQAFPKSVKI
jgi:hypothetical protein